MAADATDRGWDQVARRLLRKLRRPSALERDELAQSLRAAYGCATAREALVLAIERGLRDHDRRLAAIIRRCDIDGELTHTVAAELSFSPRHFFRYRGEAVFAVATEIDRALRAVDASRDPQRKEALHAYAMGRYLWQRFDRADCRLSIDWLERAIDAAPRLVEGWTALASANVSLALASAHEANDAIARARTCVQRAAELAPLSPAVQAANAAVTLWQTRNVKRTRDLAHIALDHDDGTAQAHFALAWSAVVEGDLESAERSFTSASAAEPESFRYMAAAMTLPFFRGDYAAAAARARELLEIEPSCGFVLGYLTESLNATGRYAETIEVAAPVAGASHSTSVTTAYARALALSGDREGALAVRSVFRGPAVMQSAIDLALGDTARALDMLECATSEDNGLLAVVDFDPAFEPLRAEPRYAKVLSTYRAAARG
jgi:tetratricopeptide (TPR) repeat protein